jgi:hypothetical protein
LPIDKTCFSEVPSGFRITQLNQIPEVIKGALKKEISTPPDIKFIAFSAVKGM